MDEKLPQIVVAQLGARMHYAVPRILHEAGMLAHFYTDICATKGWPRFLRAVPSPLRPKGLRRLLGRVPHGVPPNKITAFSDLGWCYSRRLPQLQSATESTRFCMSVGAEFGRRVIASNFDGAGAVYTFNTAGFEIMQAAKRLGLKTFMEQTIVPAEIERSLLVKESAKHPEWPSPMENRAYPEKIRREANEWALADAIFCGSEFVRESIAAVGGPVEKCVVVPYGVDPSTFPLKDQVSLEKPLRVLLIGSLGLRKGTPNVLEAARRLQRLATFRIIGPSNVPATVAARISNNVEIIGQVPRSAVCKQYHWADVVLVPSICEGSATVTYEAVSCGVPVVCTRNAGAISECAFYLQDATVTAIVDAIEQLVLDRSMLTSLRARCRRSRPLVSFDAYAERLTSAVSTIMTGKLVDATANATS